MLKAQQITELITEKAKAVGALKAIAKYIKQKKPGNLTEAQHMLSLVSVIASETLTEVPA